MAGKSDTAAAKAKTAPAAKAAAKTPARKAAPRKSAAEVAAAKSKSSKAPVKAKAPVKKTVAKKPVVKKAVAKPVAKPATAKPATAKASARPTSVASLLAHVEAVTAKLADADKANRRQVRALEKALADLEAKSSGSVSDTRRRLEGRIRDLRSQLSTLAYDTRRMAREDLKEAMAAENADTMARILRAAEARIEESAGEGREAVARLNAHLADIARAADARIVAVESAQRAETDARAKAVETINARVDRVESDTARAVEGIGERMVSLATRLRSDIEAVKAQGTTEDIGERVEKLAEQTQSDVNALELRMERMLDRRMEAAGAFTDVDARIAQLGQAQRHEVMRLINRMEKLEQKLSEGGASPAVAPEPVAKTSSKPASKPSAASKAAPIVNFTPTPDTSTRKPVEWTPAPQPTAVAAGAGLLPTLPARGIPQPEPIQSGSIQPGSVQPDFVLPRAGIPQPSEASLPYVDPGYAENLSRPGGGEGEPRPGLLSRLRGRHLRTAGLAVGVLAGGTFLLGKLMAPDAPEPYVAEAPVDVVPQVDASAPPPPPPVQVAEAGPFAAGPFADGATPPIGDISDINVVAPAKSSDSFATLEAAVEGGNPVALYQMGLMKVESGELDEAVRLVRQASDAGLPAAQYRLAKFYETGEGVAKDPATAFRLTEMAARRGHRLAMHDTAYFYAEGASGAPDHATALGWFERAARLGVLDSQFNLAYMLHQGEGLGITPKLEDAYLWYSVAAEAGDQQARSQIEELKRGFAPEQIAELDARVERFRLQPIDRAANGYFEGLPWMSPETDVPVDREGVRQMQALLNSLGHPVGTPDGDAGKKTRAAIRAWETAQGRSPTGQPTAALLRELEQAAAGA